MTADVMTIGLDLAKNTFYAVALDTHGHQRWQRKLRRSQLLDFLARQPVALVAMEACAGAHYWARAVESLGHQACLLPAQHVRSYRRGQKNDYNDATAIAEAALHGRIRPARPKTLAEQELQCLHRMRQLQVAERTRLINQLRGLLAEFGRVMPQGRSAFERSLLPLLEVDAGLPEGRRQMLLRRWDAYRRLNDELDWYDRRLQEQVRTDPACQRLMEIPGFGPVVSSAFRAVLGDGRQFRRGREAAASLGLVPRQHSTGGRTQLLGITKRGDRQLRSLLTHAARAVVRRAAHQDDRLSRWIQALLQRRGHNKTVIAVANKLARIGWVILAREEHYQPQTS